MTSFYGGPAGSSFVLKKVFRNKEEMKQDLDQRWQSPIGVGDFVFIAYGLPGDAENIFNTNQQIDLDKYHKSYNSTLWQKIYLEDANDQVDELTGVEKFFLSVNEDEEVNYGLGYRLITAMTGNTPKFSIKTEWFDPKNPDELLPKVEINNEIADTPILTFYLPKGQKILYQEEESRKVLDANQDPQIIWDESNLAYPELTIKLPKSQTIKLGTINKNNAGTDPSVILDDTTDVNNPTLNFELPKGQKINYQGLTTLNAGQPPKVNWNDTTDVNNPTLSFELPQGQKIKLGSVTEKPAGDPPKVILDDTTDVNNPTLSFELPKGQTVQVAEQSEKINADQDPYVTMDDTDKTHPELTFHLPQSQVMGDPTTIPAPPAAPPSVEINNTNINAPKLEFSLPRAVRFEYGNSLGEKTEPSYQLVSTTLDVGDYYINESTGFVYLVTAKDNETVTVEYEATLQAPLPNVDADFKPTYEQSESGEWVQAKPEVSESYSDEANQKGWNLQFTLPQFPNVEVDDNFIGASELGNASAAPAGENLLRFTFNIPRGSRIFAGNEVDRNTLTAAIGEAKPGDYYINTNKDDKVSGGDVYELVPTSSEPAAASSWVLKGNIRGPIGEKLSTVASYDLSNQAGDGIDQVASADTLEVTAPIVEALYGKELKPYEMIAVNYFYNEEMTSYWYFQVNTVWDRVKITGGLGEILKNNYIAPTDTSASLTETAYTVDYVNKLIVAEPLESDKVIKTYTAKKIDSMVEQSIVVWGDFSTLALFLEKMWGDKTEIGDETWWRNLQIAILSATPEERAACIGKTKKVVLTSSVLGTTVHEVMCIGADQDGDKTLTFQTMTCMKDSIVFGSDAVWIGSTARAKCQEYYNAFPGKNYIKTVSKGTCPDTSKSRNGSVIYNDETVFLLSEREFGFDRDRFAPISVANSTTTKAECTYGYNEPYSRCSFPFYKDNGSGSASSDYGTPWMRSRHYDPAFSDYLCYMNSGGSVHYGTYNDSRGLAPAFVIG